MEERNLVNIMIDDKPYHFITPIDIKIDLDPHYGHENLYRAVSDKLDIEGFGHSFDYAAADVAEIFERRFLFYKNTIDNKLTETQKEQKQFYLGLVKEGENSSFIPNQPLLPALGEYSLPNSDYAKGYSEGFRDAKEMMIGDFVKFMSSIFNLNPTPKQ